MQENNEVIGADIISLFRKYSECYFDSVLHNSPVEVEWSNRMKTCAGITYLNGKGYCVIRLSMPLLKYRSVRDLQETLLHEMIHAYLYILKKETMLDRRNGGHGPVYSYPGIP